MLLPKLKRLAATLSHRPERRHVNLMATALKRSLPWCFQFLAMRTPFTDRMMRELGDVMAAGAGAVERVGFDGEHRSMAR